MYIKIKNTKYKIDGMSVKHFLELVSTFKNDNEIYFKRIGK